MQIISLQPIGIIHSPFKEPSGTPIQPRRDADAEATVEVFPEFDAVLECRTGWLEDIARRADERNADTRFHEDR